MFALGCLLGLTVGFVVAWAVRTRDVHIIHEVVMRMAIDDMFRDRVRDKWIGNKQEQLQ